DLGRQHAALDDLGLVPGLALGAFLDRLEPRLVARLDRPLGLLVGFRRRAHQPAALGDVFRVGGKAGQRQEQQGEGDRQTPHDLSLVFNLRSRILTGLSRPAQGERAMDDQPNRALSTQAYQERPDYKVELEPTARRIRVAFNGVVIADTTRAMLMRESRHRPVYYLPLADIRPDVIAPTDHQTHCPFKGHAAYWTVTVGDRIAENAL